MVRFPARTAPPSLGEAWLWLALAAIRSKVEESGEGIVMWDSRFTSDFSGEVPIFPLPRVAFFPGTKLPLHLFEPRYIKMLLDVHRGEQMIAMVALDSDTGAKVLRSPQSPPIRKVAGLGRLTRLERLPDGLFNIELFGLSRVAILEELPLTKPYRVARVKALTDLGSELAKSLKQESLDRAFQLFNEVLQKYSRFPGEFFTRFKEIPFGLLVDILSHHAPCGIDMKQHLFEECDPLKRCQSLISILEQIQQLPEVGHRASALSLFPSPSLN